MQHRWRGAAGRFLALFAALLLAASTFAALRGRATLVFHHELTGEDPFSKPRAFETSPAGLAVLFDADFLFVSKEGTLRRQPSLTRDPLDRLALGARGDASFAFYRPRSESSSELRAAHMDEQGKTTFDVELGETRDDTCGTGHQSHDVALQGNLTWVWSARPNSALLALDTQGRKGQRIEPCRCAGQPHCFCVVLSLDQYPGGLVVKMYSEEIQVPEVAWFDPQGKLLGRQLLHRRPPVAFDGNGSFVWVTNAQNEGCAPASGADEFRMIRLEASGCTSGPALPGALFSSPPLGIVATTNVVYVITDGSATPSWKRRLRGHSDGFQPVIHRLDPSGRYLDSRWISLPGHHSPRPFSESKFGLVSEDILVMALHRDNSDQGQARWSLFGVHY